MPYRIILRTHTLIVYVNKKMLAEDDLHLAAVTTTYTPFLGIHVQRTREQNTPEQTATGIVLQ